MKKTPHFPAIPLPHPLLMLEEHVAAGFPNPCEEFLSKSISLDELLIKRASSTFLVRVRGDSMTPTIPCGSILIVDKSIKAKNGSIVVAAYSHASRSPNTI
jgi:SOS-response transcriptional repressor LexA